MIDTRPACYAGSSEGKRYTPSAHNSFRADFVILSFTSKQM